MVVICADVIVVVPVNSWTIALVVESLKFLRFLKYPMMHLAALSSAGLGVGSLGRNMGVLVLFGFPQFSLK
jgi:hypothetical protein